MRSSYLLKLAYFVFFIGTIILSINQTKPLPLTSISGYVRNVQSSVFSERTVSLLGQNDQVQVVPIDSNGFFIFTGLQPGEYDLQWADQYIKVVKPRGGNLRNVLVTSFEQPVSVFMLTGVILGSLFLGILIFWYGANGFIFVPNRSLATAFFVLTLTPFIRYVVLTLEHTGCLLWLENLSLSFFTWEGAGLIFLGAGFFHYFVEYLELPQRKYIKLVYIFPLLYLPILLSWPLLGNNLAYSSLWLFSSETWNKIHFAYSTLLIVGTLWLIVKHGKPKDIWIVRVSIASAGLFIIFIALPQIMAISLSNLYYYFTGALLMLAFYGMFMWTMMSKVAELRKSSQLTQELAFLGQTAQILAHDLKSPLSAIKTLAMTLPKRIRDEDFLLEFADIVPRQVEKIDLFINRLLGFQKVAVKKEQLDIGKEAENILDVLKPKADQKGIKIGLICARGTSLQMERIHFDQLLINIVTNAIEAIEHEHGEIQVRVRKTPEGFKFQIRDNGSGMTEEVRQKIFTPFYTTKESGTGLGLASVMNVVNLYHGMVEVQSEPGKWTNVEITIPESL